MTGAPRSHQRIPDFLSNFLALANFMRLSLKKAAHADVGGPRAGNPRTWDENDGRSPTTAFALYQGTTLVVP
jgi:hypothetical protein